MSVEEPDGDDNVGEFHELEGINWDFSSADTKTSSHGVHWYPARMVPQLPRKLFDYFLQSGILAEGDTVLDPFGGSGTTALEANHAGLNAKLVDLNPLACMIARCKTTPLDISTVYTAYRDLLIGELPESETPLRDGLSTIASMYEYGDQSALPKPEVNERFDWFPEPQLYQLGHLSNRLDVMEDEYGENVTRYFRVCLSLTARRTSYQRDKEFKRYRIPEADRDSHEPDVYQIFTDIISDKICTISGLNESIPDGVSSTIECADSRFPPFDDDFKADLVLTSPPYGDHQTTVTYGEFSLDQAVIAMNEPRERMKNVDKKGLGGTKSPLEPMEGLRKKSLTLDRTIEALEEKDGRSEEALMFFQDYYEVIKQIDRFLRTGQPAVVVVSNRTMSRVVIPTHRISIELFEYLDLDHKLDLSRSLPTKILPRKNSPKNIVGEKGDTMDDEHILIFKKSH